VPVRIHGGQAADETADRPVQISPRETKKMGPLEWVILIVVLLVVFGGGGGYYYSRRRA
jgi:hypothetical protein